MQRLATQFAVCAILCAACLCAGATSLVVAALSDLSFDDVSPTTGALRGAVPLCVSMDTPGAYRLRAYGSGDAGAFELGGGVRPVAFSVRFHDRRRGAGHWVQAGEEVGGFQTSQTLHNGACRRLNAQVSVRFAAQALEAAAGGRYSGTLLLTVSPE
jgi:hypothetical protein